MIKTDEHCGTPTEKASEFLDHHLQPIMKSGVSYIKDTNDFLFKLKNLSKIPENAFLVTADVVGLHPSIPHDEGLEVLRKQLNTFDNKSIPTEDLVKMAEFVLKNNYFEFNSTVKHQISETAIGTKFAPPYACIFMDYIEREFLKSKEIQPWIWFRYIDDIFFIWTASEKELDEFLNCLNSFHPNLRFTNKHSRKSLNFLDVIVKIQQCEFVTDLYCKSTDGHQYLHFDSCHTSHTKTSIVYSQALRMKRICSRRSDLIVNINKIKDWFRERGYPKEIVNKETKQALESSISSSNNKSKKNTQGDRQKGILLVVTYNPFLCHLGQTIRKNLFLLYQDEEVKCVFTPVPFVSFCTARTNLVRAKVYPAEERLVGSRKCLRNRCQVCKNVVETDTFLSFVDKKVYKINHRFTCSDKCLVYLLSCKVYGQQYTGQTVDEFRYMWNNYKDNNRKSLRGDEQKQAGFFAHFQSLDHNGFPEDTEITFIDKTDPFDPTRSEDFWIDTLKTHYLLGLSNIDIYH